ncbi:serine/threonine-protein kinase [Streptomyces boluensis]|uniref:non-specific serine/threonine protein kinase n=1 Tax=Streptomyces boluensis TaxID=1775135 RepID=A0A964US27_9ACTN|nr:serine/threonine-protein kinase [Streptomyces boluensis]NBE53401.1 protein kinase [Streptomyces boluensis]
MTSATGGDSDDNVEGGIKPLTAADPDRIGPYLLLGRLGAGGMGRVYLARSESGRTAAVKVVHEEHVADSQFRARFRREIGAARKVDKRYTAPVLDADPDAALPWVATGYVPGLSLEQVVRGHGPLPAEAVHALADGLLRALRDIHGAGIVHRDLKPSNVMLTVDGPRVIDFGIARAVQTSAESMLTSTGMVIGSPGFMAPEQVLGESTGPKCDVFALGCLLGYAATGQLPFGHGASNQHAVMYRIVEGEPELDGLRDDKLRALALRCLAKGVDERPDVDELLADPERLAALPPGGVHLPGAVVTHLAQQAARFLDAEAVTPVREEAPAPAVAPTDAPTDRDTAKLGPAAGAAATVGTDTPQKPARRRRGWVLALSVAAVLALSGGTIVLLEPFGGKGREDAAPPGGGGASSAGPDSPSSPSGSPSEKGKEKKKDEDGKDDGKGKDGSDGKDGASGADGGGAGDADGGTDASGGGSSGDGSAAGDGSGSGDSSGDDSGPSGGGSGDSGSSGGGSGAVPSYFVDSWRYADQYNVGQPGTVTISGGGAVRLVMNTNGMACTYAAKVTSTANEGSRINVGTQTLTAGTPGPCYETKDPSYFTISGSGIRYVPGPSHGDGYLYKRS